MSPVSTPREAAIACAPNAVVKPGRNQRATIPRAGEGPTVAGVPRGISAFQAQMAVLHDGRAAAALTGSDRCDPGTISSSVCASRIGFTTRCRRR